MEEKKLLKSYFDSLSRDEIRALLLGRDWKRFEADLFEPKSSAEEASSVVSDEHEAWTRFERLRGLLLKSLHSLGEHS